MDPDDFWNDQVYEGPGGGDQALGGGQADEAQADDAVEPTYAFGRAEPATEIGHTYSYDGEFEPDRPPWWRVRDRWALMPIAYRLNSVLYGLAAVCLVVLILEVAGGEDSDLDAASELSVIPSTTSTTRSARSTTTSRVPASTTSVPAATPTTRSSGALTAASIGTLPIAPAPTDPPPDTPPDTSSADTSPPDTTAPPPPPTTTSPATTSPVTPTSGSIPTTTERTVPTIRPPMSRPTFTVPTYSVPTIRR